MLVEYHGCDPAALDDRKRIEELMLRAVKAAGATPIHPFFHRFSPQGVSGVVVVAESHLSIHTWPETGYAAADFYTCGECVPERAARVLGEGLGADAAEMLVIDRGQGGPGESIQLRDQKIETTDPDEAARAAS